MSNITIRELADVLQLAITQTMEDGNTKGRVAQVSSIASHSKNNEEELERRFCRKVTTSVEKKLEIILKKSRSLNFGYPSYDNGEYVSIIYLQEDIVTKVGKLKQKIIEREEYITGSAKETEENFEKNLDLQMRFTVVLEDYPEYALVFPFSPLVKNLRVAKEQRPIETLDPTCESPIFIDLEWVSCYKKKSHETWIHPAQVSEYAFLWENQMYHSGFLKVDTIYTKKVRRKFLEKLEISNVDLVQRHKNGRDFYEDFEANLWPIMQEIKRQNKKPVFIFFGTEDGKILKHLMGEDDYQNYGYVDITQRFSISNFGQSALLNGLGVEFTHDFSSDMDVRALFLIYQVFSQASTVQEAKSLLIALQLEKMVAQSGNPRRLAYYLHLYMGQPLTRKMLAKGKEMAENFGQEL